MALASVAETEARLRERLVPIEAYRAHLDGEEFLFRLADGRPGDDRPLRGRDARSPVHPCRSRPARRAESPYGGTIAHGFLTLSLLSTLAYDALPGVVGTKMGVNYGFDKVRFLNPVRVGTRVRGRFRMIGLTERAVTLQTSWDAAVEIEGGVKPALSAHWITVAVIEPPAE
jgi:hypothetical protein